MPCYERPDLADDSDQVLAMLIENLRRHDLTELEEARGYQQLLDLRLSATKIAKATGTPRTRVRDALAVTNSDTALTTATNHGLTLDQALVLTEFEDDDEALDTLTDTAVEDPDGLLHVASRIRQDRRQAQYERLVAEHEAAGVTILDQRPDSYSTKALGVPRILDSLIDGDDQGPRPRTARQLPRSRRVDRVIQLAGPPPGLRLRGPAGLRAPQPLRHRRREQAPRTSQGRTTRGHREQQGVAGRRASPPRPHPQLAHRRQGPQGHPPVRHRRDHGRPRGDRPRLRRHDRPARGDHRRTHRDRPLPVGAHRRPRPRGQGQRRRLPLVLLAQVAAAREQSMDVHTWRSSTAQAEARWLNFLAQTSYPLSPIEQTVIDKMAASPDDEEQPDPPKAPGTEPAGDEAAA